MLKRWQSLLRCELAICVCFVCAYTLPALSNKLHTPRLFRTQNQNIWRQLTQVKKQPRSCPAWFCPHWPCTSGLCVDTGGVRIKWERICVQVGLSALLPSGKSNKHAPPPTHDACVASAAACKKALVVLCSEKRTPFWWGKTIQGSLRARWRKNPRAFVPPSLQGMTGNGHFNTWQLVFQWQGGILQGMHTMDK